MCDALVFWKHSWRFALVNEVSFCSLSNLNCVFCICAAGPRLKFSRIRVTETFPMGLKTDLTTNWMTLVFVCYIGLRFINFIPLWTEISKFCSNLFLLRWKIIFSIVSLRGILAWSLNSPAHLPIGFPLIMLSFNNAVQLDFLCLNVFQYNFFSSIGELTFWWLLKTI